MGSASAGVGSALPNQDGFSGYVLTTDGITPSWEPSSAALPVQTGNAGKFLSTNGTVASWEASLPAQTAPDAGKFLTTNGTVASWVTVTSGVNALGAVGAAPAAEGASITGTTLTLQPADATHPGVVTAAAQTFGGTKTFPVVVATGDAIATASVTSQLCTTAGGTSAGVAIGYGSSFAQILQSDGAYAQLRAPTGLVYLVSSGSGIAVFGSGTADMTGLGNGGSIKLKAPGGTTFTATISDGGAWVIT